MATRTLNVVVAGDVKGLGRAMGQAERDIGRLQRSTKSAGRDTTAFASVTSSGFSRVGIAARGMAVAGNGGAALLAKTFVTAASAINESLSKNRVLFGQYARQVDQFSKTSATSFGISRRAALEYTGVFGNLFRALGESQKSSAGMSVRLTQLAADMASFNNTSIEQALEAIRSGLVGETEPLRKFGVNMNDATLRAEALRLGLVKTTKEALTPQTKALAANALIFRQTANAHGDAKKTQGELAGQMKVLRAQAEDLSAVLGQALTPSITRGLRATTGFVTEMRRGKGEGGKFARSMGDVAQVLGTLARAFIIAGKAVVFAVKAVQRFLRTGQMIGTAIGDSINAAGKMGSAIGTALIRGITSGIRKAAGAVKGAISGAIGKVKDFAGIGDGIGKQISGTFPLPRGGSISGDLKGAQPGMRPFAAMGQRFGLGVTSGRRTGAITSTGNRSWHSTGEAVDLGGSASGMMSFAKSMRSRFGGRLAELIYTPMGVGIKNGQPHRYGGKVAADHFDHVHVAMDLGRPGQGDGIGTPASNARTVVSIGRRMGASDKEILAALETILVEALGRNVTHGDRDSEGAFQQRPSQGWGPASESLSTDAAQFFRAAKKANRRGQSAGQLAQAVQRSAFPGRYDQRRADALRLLGGTGSTRRAGRRGITDREFVAPFRAGGIGGAVAGALARNTAEQLGANADVEVAQAEASGNGLRQIAALTSQRRLVGARIRKIRRALKTSKNMRPSRRLELTQELAGLVGTHAGIGSTIADLKKAPEVEAADVPEGPSPLDFLNRDTALAGLTAGTEDDLAAATAVRDFRANQFAFSRGGDPRTEAEFAEALKSAQDAVDSLTQATRDQEDAMKEHTAALQGVKDELKRQTDFASAVQTTETFQLKKMLADVVSGQIGGYGVARAFTPGSGREFSW